MCRAEPGQRRSTCLSFSSVACWCLLRRQIGSAASAARDTEWVQNYAGGVLRLWLCGNHFTMQTAGFLTVPMKCCLWGRAEPASNTALKQKRQKNSFPWIKNIPTFSLRRKGKGKNWTSITKPAIKLENAEEGWSMMTLLGLHSGYLNYLKWWFLCHELRSERHRITEWLSLEGTSENHLVWSPCSGRAISAQLSRTNSRQQVAQYSTSKLAFRAQHSAAGISSVLLTWKLSKLLLVFGLDV